MQISQLGRIAMVVILGVGMTGCGNSRSAAPQRGPLSQDDAISNNPESAPTATGGSSIWDVFGPNTTDQTVNVNKYLWAASLDVLNFLPVETVDPFTGVIVTGYGTPPGGGRSYRATVHISDPALEARSLNVSLQTSGGGAVSAATSRAVEDAILSRARQLRISDAKI